MLTLAFLGTLSLVFTAFELWKFAGSMPGGTTMLGEYLFFLTPFLYLQYLAPTAAMLSILATYVIKSRQNEIVTWISAGQSIYRLLAPCFVAMLLLGFSIGCCRSRSSRGQIRSRTSCEREIRSRGQTTDKGGRYWTFSNGQIVNFELAPPSDNESGGANSSQEAPATPIPLASDNETHLANVKIFKLEQGTGRLQTIYQSPSAKWKGDRLTLAGPVRVNQLQNGQVTSSVEPGDEIEAAGNPLVSVSEKPSYLDRRQINERIASSASETEKEHVRHRAPETIRDAVFAFDHRLFHPPFALSLSRKGKVATVGGAIGLWLLYIGLTNIFEQFGLNGMLAPEMAVWAPLALFSLLGVYLLSRVRT